MCVLSLIYVGGFFSGESFVNAFANTDATVGLPMGGLVALVLIIVYMALRGIVSFKESMECIPQGFIAMVPAILILTFATSLKNMTGLPAGNHFPCRLRTFVCNGNIMGNVRNTDSDCCRHIPARKRAFDNRNVGLPCRRCLR